MSKELIVSSSPHQTSVALMEDDQLSEIYIARGAEQGLAGSIYKGRVTRVLPGMQAAFVNIGLDRDAFLYVSDFFGDPDEFDDVPVEARSLTPAEIETLASESSEAASGEAEEPRQPAADRPGPRRERRGGRSRRRRPRRAQFPESKYASPGALSAERTAARGTEPRPSTEAKSEPAGSEAPQQEPEFTVLPGESLAKYRQARPSSSEAGGLAAAEESAPGSTKRAPEPVEPAALPSDAAEESAAAGEPSPSSRAAAGRESGETAPADRGGRSKEWRARNASAERRRPARSDRETSPAAGRAGWLDTTDSVQPGPAQAGEGLQERAGPPPRETEAAASTAENLAAAERDEQGASPTLISAEDSASARTAVAETATEAAAAGAAEGPETVAGGDEQERVPGGPAEPAASDRDEAGGSPESPRTSGKDARVRGRSGPSRFLQRRGGRRGRRRPRGQTDRGRPAAGTTVAEAAPPAEGSAAPTGISALLSQGQEILVQISKEPLGKKGARITSHIAMPGRYLVYMPTVEHVGVSRKIASDNERLRLRKIVQAHRTGMPGGFIVRTAGEEASEEEIRGDMLFLYNLWLDIRQKAERRPSPSLIHQDLDIVERVLRDQLGEDFKTIWVDAEDEYERILRFVERFQSELLSRVKLHSRPGPIFDEFRITQEIEKALRPKVWLKSGGYIVINQTEALVAIDVNTGKYVGKSDRLEDTIVKTNLEAVQEIVRQMRLRDLGGIIVVDFIDMEDRKNRHKVLAALEQELRLDRAPSKALPFNEFGLVSITRKRVKQSLERTLCTACPYCSGSGYVKSVQTVVLEILDEARKLALKKTTQKDVTLRVNPEVARTLKSRDNFYLQEIEDIFQSSVVIRSDVGLHREHFDIN